MTVPLTKVSNHFLVLQTQIVLDRQTDVFCVKNPSFSVQREQQKKLMLLSFLSIPIDAQPRGGNRQTAKRFCKLEHLPVCFVELFQSDYRLRPAPSQAGGCLVMM